MAAKYYLAKRSITNEYHLVHREGCPLMPDDAQRISLGHFISGDDALAESKALFNNSKCCRFCIPEHFCKTGEPDLVRPEIISIMPTEQQLSEYSSHSAFCFLN
jgi:hypothetical protein